jgi:hypothetical protein
VPPVVIAIIIMIVAVVLLVAVTVRTIAFAAGHGAALGSVEVAPR